MKEQDPHALPPGLPLTAAAASAGATGQELMVYSGPDIVGSSRSGGGSKELIADQAALLANIPHQPNPEGGQPFDVSYVGSLVNDHEFQQLGNYVLDYIPNTEDHAHPMLFLHVLREWVLYCIDEGHFGLAESLFANHITDLYQHVLQRDQSLVPNANLADLAKEIQFIQTCVVDKKRYDSRYTRDEISLQVLISDYLMLYLPNIKLNAERGLSKGLWQFALRIERTSRTKFRCLVCSKTFNSATIGDLKKHLPLQCPGPKSPYLQEKCKAVGVHIPLNQSEQSGPDSQPRLPTSSQPSASRKRSRTAHTDPPPMLESDDPPPMLESVLQKMAEQVTESEKLAATMGVTTSAMNQVVLNMKGLVATAQAAARSGATHSQPVTVSAPGVPIPPTGTTGVAALSTSLAYTPTPTVVAPETDTIRLPATAPPQTQDSPDFLAELLREGVFIPSADTTGVAALSTSLASTAMPSVVASETDTNRLPATAPPPRTEVIPDFLAELVTEGVFIPPADTTGVAALSTSLASTAMPSVVASETDTNRLPATAPPPRTEVIPDILDEIYRRGWC